MIEFDEQFPGVMVMFNSTAMLALLNARPFAPFRFHMSDGGVVEVPSREMVLPGRNLINGSLKRNSIQAFRHAVFRKRQ